MQVSSYKFYNNSILVKMKILLRAMYNQFNCTTREDTTLCVYAMRLPPGPSGRPPRGGGLRLPHFNVGPVIFLCCYFLHLPQFMPALCPTRRPLVWRMKQRRHLHHGFDDGLKDDFLARQPRPPRLPVLPGIGEPLRRRQRGQASPLVRLGGSP